MMVYTKGRWGVVVGCCGVGVVVAVVLGRAHQKNEPKLKKFFTPTPARVRLMVPANGSFMALYFFS